MLLLCIFAASLAPAGAEEPAAGPAARGLAPIQASARALAAKPPLRERAHAWVDEDGLWSFPPGLPPRAVPVYDPKTRRVIGFSEEAARGVFRYYDRDGREAGLWEAPTVDLTPELADWVLVGGVAVRAGRAACAGGAAVARDAACRWGAGTALHIASSQSLPKGVALELRVAAARVHAELASWGEPAVRAAAGRGAERAGRHAANWRHASLKDAVRRVCGEHPVIRRDAGKIVFRNPADRRVVRYDIGGRYFTIRDGRIGGKFNFLDLEGQVVPLNEAVVRHGRVRMPPKAYDRYMRETHFLDGPP